MPMSPTASEPLLATDTTARPERPRRLDLDVLRLVGILVIMLAHADPPRWLFQLRNFGTPLLIVASALTHAHLFAHRPLHVEAFLRKRLLRLILPAWVFLTFLFLTFAAFSLLTDTAYPFSIKAIAGSYLLYEGIGYVWIFRIYLVLALFTPIGLCLVQAVPRKRHYFALLIGCYALYEVAMAVWHPAGPGHEQSAVDRLILANIPYGLLFFYGLRLGELRARTVLIASAVVFVGFLAMAWGKAGAAGGFVDTQHFKYPPRLYYLAYAFVATNLLVLACRHLTSRHLPRGAIVWLSTHSLWVYLWHIFALQCWRQVFPLPRGDLALSLVQLAFILGLSVAATWLQCWLIRRFVDPQPRLAPVRSVLA